MKKNKTIIKDIFRYLALALIGVIIAFPFIWLIISSLKTTDEIWKFPPTLIPAAAQWNNYSDTLKAAPFGSHNGKP